MRPLGHGEAKTHGCLPGILRHVQGPPTTRRRLATGDPGDTSLRAAKLVNESTLVSNPQHWANRTSLAAPRSWKHALLSNRDARELPTYVSLSICSRSANANRFKVLPRLTYELRSLSHDASEREQRHRGTVVCGPIDDFLTSPPPHALISQPPPPPSHAPAAMFHD